MMAIPVQISSTNGTNNDGTKTVLEIPVAVNGTEEFEIGDCDSNKRIVVDTTDSEDAVGNRESTATTITAHVM